MVKQSFYDVLGIDKKASDTEIKKAYRTMSLKYHPDRNSDEGAKNKFQEINEAYETLSDNAKRQVYDMGGQEQGNGMPFNMSGNQGFPPDINGIFNMMFNGGLGNMQGMHSMGGPGGPNIRIFHGGVPHEMNRGRPQPPPVKKPEPIVKTIEITLEQSYSGCVVPVEIERWTLNNNAKEIEIETLYVNVPEGIDNNEILLLSGKGNATPEHKGDIKVCIHVRNDTIFKRIGLDLIYKTTITLKEALCGFQIDFAHLNGKNLRLNNLDNPTVIKPGHKNVFKTMGMAREGKKGSLILELDVAFPENLTDEQRNAMQDIL